MKRIFRSSRIFDEMEVVVQYAAESKFLSLRFQMIRVVVTLYGSLRFQMITVGSGLWLRSTVRR